MPRATKTAGPSATLSASVNRALREAALYVFAALALILWFSLYTYSPDDPGFSQAAASGNVANASGRLRRTSCSLSSGCPPICFR